MSTESPVYVSLEFTPNPKTLKYSVNRTLIERGACSFQKPEEATDRSPLAARLFEIPGVEAVMLGKDFVTLTKHDEGDWEVIHARSSEVIRSHLTDGKPVILGATEDRGAARDNQTETEKKIREFLEKEVRPAVAMDGGDITFERFEEGIVYVYLQGSCAGCPSSTMTLKVGIENRLKALVPEVTEVVSL